MRRAIALLYLSVKEAEDKKEGAPATSGEEWQRPAIRLAARVLVDTFEETGEPTPDWLGRLAM